MKDQCLMRRCPQSHESSPDSPSCPAASYTDLSQSYNSTKELQIKDCSIIPSELMSIHVKKIYIFSNAKATLWQLRTVYNNHLLKVQGWGEWTLMRVWSVSYRFHPID